MAGRVQWEAQVDSNIKQLLGEAKQLRDELDGIKKGNYEIKLNIDEKKLENVISNLDKMLTSLGKGTGDFKEFETLSKQLKDIVSEVQTLNRAFGNINDSGANELLSSIKNIDKSLSSLSEHIVGVNKDFSGIGKNASDNVGQINEAKKATEGLADATKELANAQKNVGNKSNISSGTQIKDVFQGNDKATTDASTTAIKEESKALEQVSDSAKEASESKEKFAKANKEVKTSADNSKTSISEEEKYFNSLGSAIEKYDNTLTSISRKPADGNRSKDLQDRIDIISSSLDELRTLESNANKDGYVFNEKDVERGKELEKIIKYNIEAVKQMSAVQKGSDEASRTKEIDKLTKYLDKNTRISKEAREQLEGYLTILKSNDPSVNVKELHTAWTKVAVAEREAGREGKSFLDIFKNKVVYNYAAQLAGYYLSFMDLIRYGKNAFNAVRELDTALVDLKKTTTMSDSELEQFYYGSNELAKKMGVTTADIINQASAWSRLGFSTKEASTQMAELSSQFASISPGMDLDSATDGLVSSMKAFDIEVENVERDIMDNINRIGNTAATSNDEIVDMLTRSSAAMSAANNTIQETIALETAAVEITRNAETTGTAFKTLSMRIRGRQSLPPYTVMYMLCA